MRGVSVPRAGQVCGLRCAGHVGITCPDARTRRGGNVDFFLLFFLQIIMHLIYRFFFFFFFFVSVLFRLCSFILRVS